ncbi:uncharacterized protein LOC124410188 [Diprion similis]|uniref:uncharacterized protein LOC124410188 n=1 Tax=Diprion similis TaxID=362088 RepID=UPI001EF7DDEF|nr:uncharacterized protein LOC124410188 [Diprion similis]
MLTYNNAYNQASSTDSVSTESPRDTKGIDASPVYDNSINQAIVYAHHPYANSSYNNNDEICILIQQQDLCVLPSESFIYIQGKAFKINVGITSTLKNYISLDQSKKNAMEIFGWKDGGYKSNHHTEDYKKIVTNARHELIIIRSRTDKNCYKTGAAAEDMRLEITKLQWRIPHVMPSDVVKLSLLRILEKNQPIQMCFRSWSLHEYPNLPKSKMQVWPIKIATQLEKPRYVIFALQRNWKENVKNHASYFDHCDLRNVKLFLNSDSYPYENRNVSRKNEQFALLYDMYAKFQYSYYGTVNRPILDMQTYIKDAPIIVIDCSRQNESIKSAPVDIRIEFESETDIEDGMAAYCLILHDRIVEYTPQTNVGFIGVRNKFVVKEVAFYENVAKTMSHDIFRDPYA